MKKFKFIFVVFSLLFISGCTSTYELNIDGNQFSETITTFIYSGDREADLNDGIESGQRIDAFVDRDVYPFFNNYDYVYKKEVKKIDDNSEQVKLKYKYSASEYEKSNAVNLCFEKRNLEFSSKYYNIDLSGYFYCLYNNDNVDIIIKTNNKVINNNADETKGNKYIWHINSENFKNVDIKLHVSSKKNNFWQYMISFVVILVIGGLGFLIIKYKTKDINKF